MPSANTEIRVGAHTTNATLSAAVTLTKPDGGDYVQLQPFTQNVRYTIDGTTPTATTGFQMGANNIYEIEVGEGATLKVIEEAASASIQYQWFGRLKDQNS